MLVLFLVIFAAIIGPAVADAGFIKGIQIALFSSAVIVFGIRFLIH